jgi:plastocyanin
MLLAALVAGSVLAIAPPAAAAGTTTTDLTSSANPSVVGDSVTLTATVTGDAPTGSVTFEDAGTSLGVVGLSGGVATLVVSTFTAGSHPLTATYSGDAGNEGSAGGLTQVVNAPPNPPAATTTALTSSANPSVVGQAVTLTATVTGAAPTGSVTFAESGTTLGTSNVTGGVATLMKSSWAAGSHPVTATYSGDPDNLGSVGALTQTVKKPVPEPKVKLAVSDSKVSVGDKVRLSWTTKHADTVTASGDWSGAKKKKGSAVVRITEHGKFVFKLTVQNASGRDTAKVKVVATRKAKELELVVTDELVLVGTDIDITADGLAKGEGYTIKLNGKPILTGKANKKGDVARTFELPKTTPEGALPLTITGSNPGRLGTAVLNVIKPKTLDVEVAAAQLPKKKEQTVTVTGLASDETVTVMYAGAKLTTGHADEAGLFTYAFNVGKEMGKRTVKVIGAVPSRVGSATFTVTTAEGDGNPAAKRRVAS